MNSPIISLKNIADISKQEIIDLVKITTKPHLMKTIGTGKIFTLKHIISYVNDEIKEAKKHYSNRNYWTYAILYDNKIVGFFSIHKIKLTPNFIKYNNTTNATKTIKITKKSSTKKHVLTNKDITIGIRIIVDDEYQGKGIATIVLKQLIDMTPIIFPKKNVNILSIIDPTNLASSKIASKNNFVKIGSHKYGNKIYNVYAYQIKYATH